jgi:iron complex transport system ATP-binding protein
MILARNITVQASSRLLVNDVSLDVARGTVTALVGPNGAGKSTLLKVLAGDVRHQHGEVTLDGRPLGAWKAADAALRRGVLPQESGLAFPFTALEVVLMGRTPHVSGGETAHDYAIADQALHAVGLGGFSERLYPTLSGGERQRVQLARVLAQIWEHDDSYGRSLLLDEPVSSLDLAQQQRVLLLARKFASDGAAVLVVLHDLNLASQYADRIALMRAGRLVAAGTPREVLTAEIIQAVFGVAVQVMDHPSVACPLVVALPM